MYGYEVRFSLGTALLTLAWVVAVALVGVAVLVSDWRLAVAGVLCGQVGLTLTLIRDNNKTRRAVRGLLNELTPVQGIRGGRG